jgi:hypothetical protein
MTEQWEVILCPICRKVIHRHFASPIQSRGRVSSRDYRAGSSLLTQMTMEAEAEHERYVLAAEAACAEHFRDKHPRRLRLWRRLKWNWLLNGPWPWSKNDYDKFDYSGQVNT